MILIPDYPRDIVISLSAKAHYFRVNADKLVTATKPKYVLPLKYIKNEYTDFVRENRKSVTLDMVRPNSCCILTKRKNKWSSTYISIDEYLDTIHSMIDFDSMEVYLSHPYTTVPIVANPTKAGKPVTQRVSFQAMYSGIHHNVRQKMVLELKKYMVPYVMKGLHLFRDITYPIGINFTIFDTVRNWTNKEEPYPDFYQRWDLDNRAYIYLKCLIDLLTSGSTGEQDADENLIQYFKPVIVDDDIIHINKIAIRFVAIEPHETPSLVLGIEHGIKDNIIAGELNSLNNISFDEKPF